MNVVHSTNNNFDFKDIFPQSHYDFNGIEWRREFRRPWLTRCSAVCNDFMNRINVSIDVSVVFNTSCYRICMYLKFIEGIAPGRENYSVSSCKYFYYKLKELMKNYAGDCKTTKECYTKMREKRGNVDRMDVPDICVKHLKGIDDIDDIYDKFQYLQKLYHIEDEFKKTWVSCDIANNLVNKYITHSAISKSMNNNKSFMEELDKVNVKYNEYRKVKSECFPSPKHSYSSLEPGADTVTGMFVLNTAILIIIFIFFKVKYNFNLVNHYSNIKDTFHRTYTNRNNRNYRIAYYSED
ncbi:variable surface protein [Plasmodium gonderi]|uniref:Variable surface protein n=1 Tax=Plasmodium gonderi TaxID=77519 RepID=A0A1Y1JRE5_PLAGO|nr:variable surface protein [Plasmodium gonderi]GAW84038.1 variable surface protein [Plasmodium gonderi]